MANRGLVWPCTPREVTVSVVPLKDWICPVVPFRKAKLSLLLMKVTYCPGESVEFAVGRSMVIRPPDDDMKPLVVDRKTAEPSISRSNCRAQICCPVHKLSVLPPAPAGSASSKYRSPGWVQV